MRMLRVDLKTGEASIVTRQSEVLLEIPDSFELNIDIKDYAYRLFKDYCNSSGIIGDDHYSSIYVKSLKQLILNQNKSYWEQIHLKVMATLTGYYNDFLIHDKETLDKHPNDSFIHATNSSGTLMMKLRKDKEEEAYPKNFYRALISSKNVFHYLHNGKAENISLDRVHDIVAEHGISKFFA